jgi:hypothetical protein
VGFEGCDVHAVLSVSGVGRRLLEQDTPYVRIEIRVAYPRRYTSVPACVSMVHSSAGMPVRYTSVPACVSKVHSSAGMPIRYTPVPACVSKVHSSAGMPIRYTSAGMCQ